MKKYKNNKKKINLYAFSLIEIMIVVLLIGLVSGTATILLFNRFNESKISIAKNQTYEITKASELYKLRFNHYPKNINQLIYPGNGIFPYMEKIPKEYNIKKTKTYTINKNGKDINSIEVKKIQKNLIKDIFSIQDSVPIKIVEKKDKFFIIEILKTESLEKNLENESLKKKVSLDLKNEKKRKIVSEIISKINQKNFDKSDFDKLSKEKEANIQKILLKNREDYKFLKKELVNQIYIHPEKNVIVVHDMAFKEIYLIYIDKIHNVSINEASEDYEKYMRLSKIKIANELFNTYDNYIRNKYKIDINYKALNTVKSYFN